MAQTDGLTIRQDARSEIELPTELVIAQRDREQVSFSALSGAADGHTTSGLTVDVSGGGLGLVCCHYVPRGCGATVRIFDRSGEDGRICIFEHDVRVRRIVMRTHEPTYSIGVAFVDPDAGMKQRVEELLATVPRTGTSDGA